MWGGLWSHHDPHGIFTPPFDFGNGGCPEAVFLHQPDVSGAEAAGDADEPSVHELWQGKVYGKCRKPA